MAGSGDTEVKTTKSGRDGYDVNVTSSSHVVLLKFIVNDGHSLRKVIESRVNVE